MEVSITETGLIKKYDKTKYCQRKWGGGEGRREAGGRRNKGIRRGKREGGKRKREDGTIPASCEERGDTDMPGAGTLSAAGTGRPAVVGVIKIIMGY